ncbi:MAG: hypothetical protein MZW92_40315 [Comamonadaceae bacterium]|nr:hypothetical protein [Comamonadaceae bacterium]
MKSLEFNENNKQNPSAINTAELGRGPRVQPVDRRHDRPDLGRRTRSVVPARRERNGRVYADLHGLAGGRGHRDMTGSASGTGTARRSRRTTSSTS